MTRLIAILVLALGLTACGFHLRGALTLPPDLGPVRVIAKDPYSPLAESLSVALEQAGATPAAEDEADHVAPMRIPPEQWGCTPITIRKFRRAPAHPTASRLALRPHQHRRTTVLPARPPHR